MWISTNKINVGWNGRVQCKQSQVDFDFDNLSWFCFEWMCKKKVWWRKTKLSSPYNFPIGTKIKKNRRCLSLLPKVVAERLNSCDCQNAIVMGNQHFLQIDNKTPTAQHNTHKRKNYIVHHHKFHGLYHLLPLKLLPKSILPTNLLAIYFAGNVIHWQSYVTYQGDIIKNVSKASLSPLPSLSLECSFRMLRKIFHHIRCDKTDENSFLPAPVSPAP